MSPFNSRRIFRSRICRCVISWRRKTNYLIFSLFLWLVNIWLWYMLYILDKSVVIEPYMPNHFVRQFGYNQLYVGNSNPELQHGGSYFDAGRTWYFNISGCTGTRFWLPARDAMPRLCLSFYRWYSQVRHTPWFDWKISLMNLMTKTSRRSNLSSTPTVFWACENARRCVIWKRGAIRKLIPAPSHHLLREATIEEYLLWRGV